MYEEKVQIRRCLFLEENGYDSLYVLVGS